MASVRRNQAALSQEAWAAFVAAIDATHGTGAAPPAYRKFVQVHVEGMSGPGMHTWGVHSMQGMAGRNFLAWHRQYLLQFERRLQAVDAAVTIPYWDWLVDRAIPAELNQRAQLRRWSITREWRPQYLPLAAEVDAVMSRPDFDSFQRTLEQVHNNVHRAVGGEMATATSPSDPLFWVHHANIDRLWADWQKQHRRARVSNSSETLQPARLFGVPVSGVLKVSKLGYRYG